MYIITLYEFITVAEQVLSDQIPRCEMAGCKGVVKPGESVCVLVFR